MLVFTQYTYTLFNAMGELFLPFSSRILKPWLEVTNSLLAGDDYVIHKAQE